MPAKSRNDDQDAEGKIRVTMDDLVDREFAEIPGSPILLTGTGRCGTHFFAALFEKDPRYWSQHADDGNQVGDAFYRFCRFNRLPVDIGGFVWARRCLVDIAARHGKLYFESSALLSHNVLDFHHYLDGSVILVVRHPLDVIPSSMGQKVYDRPRRYLGDAAVFGYNYDTVTPFHAFSQLVPGGDDFAQWNSLTVAGKTAWYWNEINTAIMEQLQELPEAKKRIIRIEDFDYEEYMALSSLTPITGVSRQEFEQLRTERPGKTPGSRRRIPVSEWSTRARREVIELCRETADRFGYDVQADMAMYEKRM
jgi:hypothetical protein